MRALVGDDSNVDSLGKSVECAGSRSPARDVQFAGRQQRDLIASAVENPGLQLQALLFEKSLGDSYVNSGIRNRRDGAYNYLLDFLGPH